jgi:hypothetical protein
VAAAAASGPGAAIAEGVVSGKPVFPTKRPALGGRRAVLGRSSSPLPPVERSIRSSFPTWLDDTPTPVEAQSLECGGPGRERARRLTRGRPAPPAPSRLPPRAVPPAFAGRSRQRARRVIGEGGFAGREAPRP